MRTLTLLGLLAFLLAGCPRGRHGSGGGDDDDEADVGGNGGGNVNGGGNPGGGNPGGNPDPGGDPDEDPGGPAGDPGGASNGCVALFDCIGWCADGDTDCMNQCVQAAPAEGQRAFDDIMNCYMGAGCQNLPGDESDACLEQSCPDELMACS